MCLTRSEIVPHNSTCPNFYKRYKVQTFLVAQTQAKALGCDHVPLLSHEKLG